MMKQILKKSNKKRQMLKWIYQVKYVNFYQFLDTLEDEFIKKNEDLRLITHVKPISINDEKIK